MEVNNKRKKYIKRSKKVYFKPKLQIQSDKYKVKRGSLTVEKSSKKTNKYNNTHVHILIRKYQMNTLVQFLHTYPKLSYKFKCKKDANGQISFDEFKRFWKKHIDLPPDIIPCYKQKVCYDPISIPKNEIEIIHSNYKCSCYNITPKQYKMILYLDRKAHGYTTQHWGNSITPTIIRYAQYHNLPILNMLNKLIPLYENIDYKKIECKLFIL